MRETIENHLLLFVHHHLLLVTNTLKQQQQQKQTIIKIHPFNELKNQNQEVVSPPFYTSPNGYKMRLKVYPNGYGKGKGSHLSVFVHIEKGENDDQLVWPFRGTYTVTLLNQKSNQNHYSYQLVVNSEDIEKYPNSFNKPTSSFIEGFGLPHFVTHEKVMERSETTAYLEEDTVYVKVTAEPEKHWLLS